MTEGAGCLASGPGCLGLAGEESWVQLALVLPPRGPLREDGEERRGHAGSRRSDNRIKVHQFVYEGRILSIPRLSQPRSMTFFRCALATALLALTACHAAPVHAGVGTAAWSTAGSICRALGAGLTIRAAVRVGLSDNAYLWSAEMRDPSFQQLMVAAATRQCPEQLIRAVNEGRTEL